MTEVLQKDEKFYTFDPTSFGAKVGDKTLCFTLDYFAYIDPTTKCVYTTDGEDLLPSTPVVAGAALKSAKPSVANA